MGFIYIFKSFVVTLAVFLALVLSLWAPALLEDAPVWLGWGEAINRKNKMSGVRDVLAVFGDPG